MGPRLLDTCVIFYFLHGTANYDYVALVFYFLRSNGGWRHSAHWLANGGSRRSAARLRSQCRRPVSACV